MPSELSCRTPVCFELTAQIRKQMHSVTQITARPRGGSDLYLEQFLVVGKRHGLHSVGRIDVYYGFHNVKGPPSEGA